MQKKCVKLFTDFLTAYQIISVLLPMDSNKLKLIIIGALALAVALYLGFSAATAQFETIAWVVGTAAIVGCALMGHKIWLLLPFLASLKLTLMIPGRPTTELLGQLLVVVFSVLMFLMRRLNFRLKITELEWWVILLTLCVVQVYIRNPVGVSLFGGNQVGGRPYFVYGMALMSGLLLCGLRVAPKELWTAFKLTIAGGLLNFLIGLVGWFYLPVGYWLGQVEVSSSSSEQGALDAGKATRVNFLVNIPMTLARWVSAFESPIKACFKPQWMPMVLLSLAFAAISGYRNVVGAVALTYMVGVYYRGGALHVMMSLLAGMLTLGLMAVINLSIPLPANIQRAVSFLPGTWEKRYIEDARDSTEWRVEMWRDALLTDRWIHDKLLGDGLGFTAREIDYQRSMQLAHMTTLRGRSGIDLQREYVMINGDYHSGPVSAIRTIGYVGLLVMALAQIRLAIHAHRQIKRCKGTEWYPVALLFGIPVIWNPVFFWLIFGGFGIDAPYILISVGMLRLLENNLPLPPYVVNGYRAIVPVPLANGRVPLAVRL